MILGIDGKPITSSKKSSDDIAAKAKFYKRQMMKAKYDAAQTITENELHWKNSDNLDPHQAASLEVRRTLRSRSRYEVIENNPYLKGTILTIANDFVGTGPKLQITDERLSKERKLQIENRWKEWSKRVNLRKKLWRSRVAKIVDGETFLRAYTNKRIKYSVQLDFQIIECDRISTESILGPQLIKTEENEIDGVRFDNYENPISYYLLKQHPGSSGIRWVRSSNPGEWIDSKYMIHWFRQDRGWLRGIPETTPSLPLCAILRRYTLAALRHAETAADLTAIIKSEGPPNLDQWTDENGEFLEDDPYDTFPIERGSILNLPWSYDVTQLSAVPQGMHYDEFVGSILREIMRPLLITYNLAAGTSKDANMASAVVDLDVYRGGQHAERYDCESSVLYDVASLWWEEGVRVSGYFGDDLLSTDRSFETLPAHRWRWDKVSEQHTDPQKVANALSTMNEHGFTTDRDIQETVFNRSVDEWRKEKEEDMKFRKRVFGDTSNSSTTEQVEEEV